MFMLLHAVLIPKNAIHAFIHMHVLLNLFEDSMESILNLITKFKITILLFLIIIWLF